MRGEHVPPTRAVMELTETPTKPKSVVAAGELPDCVETQHKFAGPSPPVGPGPPPLGVGVAAARIARGARTASLENIIVKFGS